MYYRIDEKMIGLASWLIDAIKNMDESNMTMAQVYQGVGELAKRMGEHRFVTRMVDNVDSGSLMGIAIMMILMAGVKGAYELNYDLATCAFDDSVVLDTARKIFGNKIADALKDLMDLFREAEPV